MATITGTTGDDSLGPAAGADLYQGLAGNDTIDGGGGNDTLDGGDGFDFYNYSTNTWGSDTIIDSGGWDFVDLNQVTTALTINLTSSTGHEVTNGSHFINWASDIIEGVQGGTGNDLIYGSINHDLLIGGGGNDTLSGGAGWDTYEYNINRLAWGHDTIIDSGDTDKIDFYANGWSVSSSVTINLNSGTGHEATDGTNTVNWAGNVIENASGGSGNDFIIGNSDANHIAGYGGNDTIEGGGGNDTLDGGDGNDLYYYQNGWGADSIIDSSGIDRVTFNTNALTINLTSGTGHEVTDGTNTINWAGDIIEVAEGSFNSDMIYGNSGANTLRGQDGNDTIYAGQGNDSIDAGSGDDFISGEEGNDTVNGSTGQDTYYSWQTNFGNDTIIDPDSDGFLNISSNNTNNLTINLNASTGDEVYDGLGNSFNWAPLVIVNVRGGAGNDYIYGSSWANYLSGGSGNDTIEGGAGNDTLDGGSSGDDVFRFTSASWSGAKTIQDTAGTDELDFSSSISASLTINLTSSAGHEVTDGTNTLNWASDIIENTNGGSGNDVIYGNSGNNSLLGGGGGNDTLRGLLGNDTLEGENGNDFLDGGDGDDTYYFRSGWGTDTLTDSSGSDAIDVSSSVSNNITVNLTSGAGHEFTDGTNTINWASNVIEHVALRGTGNDSVFGSSGANNILTGNGNDTLDGGTGNDTLDGGAGDDVYLYSTVGFGNDSIIDLSGGDEIQFTTSQNVTINLTSGTGNEVSDGTNTANWAGDAIDHATGGAGNDFIIGNTGNNWLNGGNGNDTLDGNSGNDVFSFAANGWGSDSIIDSAGSDSVILSGISNPLTRTHPVIF